MSGDVDRGRAAANLINGSVAWVIRHWLALVNGFIAAYIGLAIAAPLLTMAGWDGLAGVIYFLFRFSCHQLPQRSFFLAGPEVAYPFETIAPLVGAADRLDLLWQPIRDSRLGLGLQMAFCQRDTAIYSSILLGGLVYAASGRRWRPLPWYGLVLLAIPIAVDGFSQLPGWRESTPVLRSLTGALFGLAVVWFAYPYVERSMREMGATLAARMRGTRIA